MDAFAHLASGALLGRAARPTGEHWRQFAFFGAIAGISPDIDAPIALFGAEAWAQWHQLLTHSLLGLAVVPALLASLPFRFALFRTRYALALSGWSLHVLLDVVARWPVPVLWPLGTQRWALFLTQSDFSWSLDMLLVVGLATSLWEPAMRHGRSIALATGIVLVVWLYAGLPC